MMPVAGSDRFQANCPNCGAPIKFTYKQAVQTTCMFCKSVLVRQGVDLQLVGQVADPLIDSSPIQIATEGQHGGQPFVVVGRIVYEYGGGRWNEWYLAFNDGANGWLSDAQLEYAISFPLAAQVPSQLARGERLQIGSEVFTVTTQTRARYVGVEGEMPFTTWDKTECTFVDLKTPTRRFATVDYSEQPPLVFAGLQVDYDDLKLRNVKIFEGWQ